MREEEFSDLVVRQIMERWPGTMAVFIDHGMHCVGCPIGVFHTLADAAEEHGIPLGLLEKDVIAAIAGAVRAGPARARHRSAATGEGPSPGASAVRPLPVLRLPRR
jgi:hybrid cluster-associated redox disulfide protein